MAVPYAFTIVSSFPKTFAIVSYKTPGVAMQGPFWQLIPRSPTTSLWQGIDAAPWLSVLRMFNPLTGNKPSFSFSVDLLQSAAPVG